MGQKYIQSTCGADMVYNINDPVDPKSDQQNVSVRAKITIKGGVGIITKDSLIPKVMRTPVTDDELEALMKNQAFVNARKRGFLEIIDEDQTSYDAHGNVSGMEQHDNCAQIRDEDHAHGRDPRCDHAGTRAAYGEDNINGGEQPDSVNMGNYGQINF